MIVYYAFIILLVLLIIGRLLFKSGILGVDEKTARVTIRKRK